MLFSFASTGVYALIVDSCALRLITIPATIIASIVTCPGWDNFIISLKVFNTFVYTLW